MCCLNVIVTGSLDTGAVHVAFEKVTWTGSGSVNAPLARQQVSPTDSVASPAVEITFAEPVASYVLSTPGVNAPKVAAGPSVSPSVAGTEPPALPAPPPSVASTDRSSRQIERPKVAANSVLPSPESLMSSTGT